MAFSPSMIGTALVAAGLAAVTLVPAAAERREPVPNHVRFEPIVVPIYEDDRMAGLIGVRLVLDADSRTARRRLERLRPRLTDAWLTALVEHGRLHLYADQPLDMDALDTALSDAVAGETRGQADLLIIEAMAYGA
ncbi:MAG: hypothetical protein AAF205_09730 [Pseudomonadota bacterium]